MLFFIPVILALSDASNIMNAIEALHNKTKFRTFYEMFDVRETTDIKTIRSKFYKLVKQKNPFPQLQIPKGTAEKILTDGYNILNKHKYEYDTLLKSRSTIPIEPKTKILFYVNVVTFALFLIIFTDLLICFFKFLIVRRKYEGVDKTKEKELRRKGTIQAFTFEKMYIVRFYRRLRRIW